MSAYYSELSPRFGEFIRGLGPEKICVLGHARPDGDCIGSQLGISRVLTALGHDTYCINPDPVPRRLQFVTAGTPFLPPDGFADCGELAIYVDCADHTRSGKELRERFPAPLGNIDHHVSNTGFARFDFVDPGSAATAEILAGMFLDNNLPIDAVTAQALYVGILTDTGQFRHPSTSQRVFQLCSELTERGANPNLAAHELYERETPQRMRLLQHFLASLRMESGGRVCVGILPAGIFEATGSTLEDTEGLVDYTRAIDGVDIGVLIEERPPVIKASLRGKDPAYRLDQVALQFSGGGHACAAGINTHGKVEEFYQKLVKVLDQQLKRVDQQKKA